MTFSGYLRENGEVGIRNYLLVLAVTRGAHYVASMIDRMVTGTRCFIPQDEDGKSLQDRMTLGRVFIGLGMNANVGAVLIVCNGREQGYPELKPEDLAREIEKSGKPVKVLSIDEEGGLYNALGNGLRMARTLTARISASRRQEVSLGTLILGVKCGLSDATSGIAGNPVVGTFFDELIGLGGRVMFSETTEVIGAEHILARRCSSEAVKEKFLECVYRVEETARQTGEDIRSINPIPANIEAGLSTLEEKSLGAISKTGTSNLEGVLSYGERAARKGLFFMDSWMSSSSLFLGYAAAGSVLNIFQLGGMVLPTDPVMPALDTGVVTPVLYTTGNPVTYSKGKDELDFNAGTVISDREEIPSAASRFAKKIIETAGGTLVKAETLKYHEKPEIYFSGPNL
jgi:altronate dehydratase large subunit